MLDRACASAANKIARGFHKVRVVSHPNYSRLIQQRVSFSFWDVYGTMRHGRVIAPKINAARETNQTFVGQMISWRAFFGSILPSSNRNTMAAMQVIVPSSCWSLRFMAACTHLWPKMGSPTCLMALISLPRTCSIWHDLVKGRFCLRSRDVRTCFCNVLLC